MRGLLTCFSLCTSLALFAQPDSTTFDNLLIDALQGNILPVLDGMDKLSDAQLPMKQQQMKRTLLQRFRAKEDDTFPTTDPAIIDLMRIYHRYWRAVMLDTSTTKLQDSLLVENIVGYLSIHRSVQDDPVPAHIKARWDELLEEHLKRHHCYSAVGKTGQYYDLLLHTRESEVLYPVSTPEDTLTVKVVFMDSVISNGWEGFATVDTYYPGGWATNEALYCAHDSYDLNSENFTVSYLKHEGQHFADYKHFPKLESPDLEYRAKLVELSTAESSLLGLIEFFMQNSAYDESNPHAYADFCVIRDLSRLLFNKDKELDLGAWTHLPIAEIHQAATSLLRKHTEALERAGAKHVATLVK